MTQAHQVRPRPRHAPTVRHSTPEVLRHKGRDSGACERTRTLMAAAERIWQEREGLYRRLAET